jgi:hypothetical protein
VIGRAAPVGRERRPHPSGCQRARRNGVDPSQVGLDLLMPDFDVRMANIGRSIGEGRLRLLQAVLRAV